MERELYRKELVQSQANLYTTPLNIARPLSHLAWSVGSLTIAATFAALLFWGHYSKRIHAVGVLVPGSGLIRVPAPFAGTVKEISAVQGSRMIKGQPLFVLSQQKNSLTIGDTSTVIADSLRKKIAQLQQDASDQGVLSQNELASLKSTAVTLESELAEFNEVTLTATTMPDVAHSAGSLAFGVVDVRRILQWTRC